MNVDQKPVDLLPKNQIESVQQKKNEIKYIGSLRQQRGHILFSFNKKTGEIKQAETELKAIATNNGLIYRKQLVIEKDCFYDNALNEKNFKKHLVKYSLLNK